MDISYIPETFSFSFTNENLAPCFYTYKKFQLVKAFLTKTPFIALNNGILIPLNEDVKIQLEGEPINDLPKNSLEFDLSNFTSVRPFLSALYHSNLTRDFSLEQLLKIKPLKLSSFSLVKDDDEKDVLTFAKDYGNREVPLFFNSTLKIMYFQEIIQAHKNILPLDLDKPYLSQINNLYPPIIEQRSLNSQISQN